MYECLDSARNNLNAIMNISNNHGNLWMQIVLISLALWGDVRGKPQVCEMRKLNSVLSLMYNII